MKYIILFTLFLFTFPLLSQVDPETDNPNDGSPDVITANITHPTIDDDCIDGSIETTVLDGDDFVLSYQWSDDGIVSAITDKDRFDLVSGEYCITVTNEFCEEASTCFTLECESFKIEGEMTPCSSENEGSIDITIIGSEAVDFKWYLDGELISTNEDLVDVGAGEYYVLVTDVDGNIKGKLFDLKCCDSEFSMSIYTYCVDGCRLIVDVDNGFPPYSIDVFGSDGQPLNSPNYEITFPNEYQIVLDVIYIPPSFNCGIIQLELSDAIGCKVTDAVSCNELPEYFRTVDNVYNNDYCYLGGLDYDMDLDQLKEKGCIEDYKFEFNGNEMTEYDSHLVNGPPGEYCATISTMQGCNGNTIKFCEYYDGPYCENFINNISVQQIIACDMCGIQITSYVSFLEGRILNSNLETVLSISEDDIPGYLEIDPDLDNFYLHLYQTAGAGTTKVNEIFYGPYNKCNSNPNETDLQVATLEFVNMNYQQYIEYCEIIPGIITVQGFMPGIDDADIAYAWSSGETTHSIQPGQEGTYFVTVTSGSCEKILSYDICICNDCEEYDPNGYNNQYYEATCEFEAIDLAHEVIPASANTSSDGSITIETTNQSLVLDWYKIEADNEVFIASGMSLNDVPHGLYRLDVTNGCEEKEFLIYVPYEDNCEIEDVSYEVRGPCLDEGVLIEFDEEIGNLYYNSNNGQSGYISSGNILFVQNDPPFEYSVIITLYDILTGCSFVVETTVSDEDPSELEIDIDLSQIQNCTDAAAGLAAVEITGGKEPYTIRWYDAEDNLVSSSETINHTSEGVYSVIVFDDCGQSQSMDVYLPCNCAVKDWSALFSETQCFDECGSLFEGDCSKIKIGNIPPGHFEILWPQDGGSTELKYGGIQNGEEEYKVPSTGIYNVVIVDLNTNCRQTYIFDFGEKIDWCVEKPVLENGLFIGVERVRQLDCEYPPDENESWVGLPLYSFNPVQYLILDYDDPCNNMQIFAEGCNGKEEFNIVATTYSDVTTTADCNELIICVHEINIGVSVQVQTEICKDSKCPRLGDVKFFAGAEIEGLSFNLDGFFEFYELCQIELDGFTHTVNESISTYVLNQWTNPGGGLEEGERYCPEFTFKTPNGTECKITRCFQVPKSLKQPCDDDELNMVINNNGRVTKFFQNDGIVYSKTATDQNLETYISDTLLTGIYDDLILVEYTASGEILALVRMDDNLVVKIYESNGNPSWSHTIANVEFEYRYERQFDAQDQFINWLVWNNTLNRYEQYYYGNHSIGTEFPDVNCNNNLPDCFVWPDGVRIELDTINGMTAISKSESEGISFDPGFALKRIIKRNSGYTLFGIMDPGYSYSAEVFNDGDYRTIGIFDLDQSFNITKSQVVDYGQDAEIRNVTYNGENLLAYSVKMRETRLIDDTWVEYPCHKLSLHTIVLAEDVVPGGGASSARVSGIDSEIRIFPNPTTGVLNIELPDYYNDKISVKIYSNDGEVLIDNRIAEQVSAHSVDMSELPSGVYMIKLIIPESKVVTKKIIKI